MKNIFFKPQSCLSIFWFCFFLEGKYLILLLSFNHPKQFLKKFKRNLNLYRNSQILGF